MQRDLGPAVCAQCLLSPQMQSQEVCPCTRPQQPIFPLCSAAPGPVQSRVAGLTLGYRRGLEGAGGQGPAFPSCAQYWIHQPEAGIQQVLGKDCGKDKCEVVCVCVYCVRGAPAPSASIFCVWVRRGHGLGSPEGRCVGRWNALRGCLGGSGPGRQHPWVLIQAGPLVAL